MRSSGYGDPPQTFRGVLNMKMKMNNNVMTNVITALRRNRVILNVWRFLRPTFLKILFLTTVASLAMLVAIERVATSKVTWDVNYGLPFSFITLAEYRGPCLPANICTEMHLQSFHLVAFLIDFVIWYIVACLIDWGRRTTMTR